MNLAFSTKFHRVSSFADFIKIADELRYEGIEIHDIKADAFSGKASPFNPDMASVTKRTLINAKKAIACIDVDCNVADKASAEKNMQKIETAVSVARNLNVPYVKVYAKSDDEDAFDYVADYLTDVISICEKNNVVVFGTDNVKNVSSDIRTIEYYPDDDALVMQLE